MRGAAIVTGGASGIGAATARRLARRGLWVFVADRDGEAAEALAARIGESDGRASAAACDVTDAAAVEALVERAASEAGEIAVLVNCAGLPGRAAHLETLSPREWELVVDVNLWGVVHGTRAVAPRMRQQGAGAIVNVASIAGLQGSRGQVAYSAAKSGVIGVTIAAAKELLDAGVRVNAVAPGFIATPMTEEMPEEMRAAWRLDQLVLGGRRGEPDQVAACIDFLCSPESSYVTGVVLPVDGGFRLGYP